MQEEIHDRPITPLERLGVAGLVTALALAYLATACSAPPPHAPAPPHVLGPFEARESAYKVEVNVKAALEDPATGTLAEPVDFEWSGSAWVGAYGVAITAGHVCEGNAYMADGTGGLGANRYKILESDYQLVSRDGVRHRAVVARDEDGDTDLCALLALDLGQPLPLAVFDPPYGAHAWDVGAPRALWGGGVAPIVDLMFSGRGKVWGEEDEPESLAFTGLGDHGSSGSAIMYDGAVVAVLTQGSGRYTRLVTGVPWDVVRAFLTRI